MPRIKSFLICCYYLHITIWCIKNEKRIFTYPLYTFARLKYLILPDLQLPSPLELVLLLILKYITSIYPFKKQGVSKYRTRHKKYSYTLGNNSINARRSANTLLKIVCELVKALWTVCSEPLKMFLPFL